MLLHSYLSNLDKATSSYAIIERFHLKLKTTTTDLGLL